MSPDWIAKDDDGCVYPIGNYGDIMAASEAACDYIDGDVVAVWAILPMGERV